MLSLISKSTHAFGEKYKKYAQALFNNLTKYIYQ